MTMSDSEMVEFAKAMLTAAEAGDYERLRDFYHSEARLWFNTTREWKTLDEHFASAGGFRGKLSAMRYAEPRIAPFEGGYVQQFVVKADIVGGGAFEMPVCIVVRMRERKIHEREEYYDSAALAPIMATS